MDFYVAILHLNFKEGSYLIYFSNISRLLTVKGLGAEDIFKICLRDGIPLKTDFGVFDK